MTAAFYKHKKRFDFMIFCFFNNDDVFDSLNKNKNILNSKLVVDDDNIFFNI